MTLHTAIDARREETLPSPEESGMGSPSVVATESDREDEAVAGPRLKKARRGGRAPRPRPVRRSSEGEQEEELRGEGSLLRSEDEDLTRRGPER